MKTREEIEKEYMTKRANNWTTYLENVNAALAARDAAPWWRRFWRVAG